MPKYIPIHKFNEKTFREISDETGLSYMCLVKRHIAKPNISYEELIRPIRVKDNDDRKRLKNIYQGIKARCYNPSHKYYHNYGGRGIGMCDEWFEDFESFYRWAIEHGYKHGLQIDKDKNIRVLGSHKGYYPENCQWVTPKENSQNKRNNIDLFIRGETLVVTQWAKRIGVNYKTIHGWIKQYGQPYAICRIEEILDNGYRPKDMCFIDIDGIERSQAEWSRLIGVSPSAVCLWIKTKGKDYAIQRIKERLNDE